MARYPFMIPAILIIAFSLPLVFRLIPRNRVYGIRTCRTVSEDAVWYPANRFGGVALILASLVYIAIALLYPAATVTPGVWSAQFMGFILPLASAVIATMLYVRRL